MSDIDEKIEEYDPSKNLSFNVRDNFSVFKPDFHGIIIKSVFVEKKEHEFAHQSIQCKLSHREEEMKKQENKKKCENCSKLTGEI